MQLSASCVDKNEMFAQAPAGLVLELSHANVATPTTKAVSSFVFKNENFES